MSADKALNPFIHNFGRHLFACNNAMLTCKTTRLFFFLVRALGGSQSASLDPSLSVLLHTLATAAQMEAEGTEPASLHPQHSAALSS